MMKQKYILLLILTLFVILLMSGVATFAQTIHIIGLVDTESDERLAGNKFVKTQLYELGRNLSVTDLKIDSVQFTQESLLDTSLIYDKIRKIKVEKNDVIFCYSAAHGYNRGGSVYPTIRFGLTNQSDIYIGKLKGVLESKNARLCIIINESCNALHKNKFFFNNNEPRSLFNLQSLKRLFVDSKGTFLMLSCDLDQKSLITEEGGIFGKAFFYTLHEQFYSESSSWEIIAQTTKRLTQRAALEYENFQQVPYIENNLSYQSTTETQSEKDVAVNVTINPYKYEDFEIEIKTDKGRENLMYYKCDTLRISIRVTKPCFIRLVDISPDNQTSLLLDNYRIDADKVGKWIEINSIPNQPYFICSQPFGVDYLLSFASQKAFCPLNFKKVNGIPYLEDDFKNAIDCTRGKLLMGAGIVLEDKIKVLTKDKFGVSCH